MQFMHFLCDATQNCRTIDALPPARVTLIQHAKRAVYQAGYCWRQMMIPAPELQSQVIFTSSINSVLSFVYFICIFKYLTAVIMHLVFDIMFQDSNTSGKG